MSFNNENTIAMTPATLKDYALYALDGSDDENDFWQLPRQYIDSVLTMDRRFLGDDMYLSNEHTMKIEPFVEWYVSHGEIYERNDLRQYEYTKEWIDRCYDVMVNFNYNMREGLHIHFDSCRIAVTLNWFKTLQHLFENGYTMDKLRTQVPYHDILGSHMRLLLSGDVETNPGPVQSRPLLDRNNDPRLAKLERALERQEQKNKSLIKHLRQAIKNRRNKIYTQFFFDIRGLVTDSTTKLDSMSASLNRMCDFLETSLPLLQNNVQNLMNMTDRADRIKEDIVKITLICLLLRLLMIWKHHRTALAVLLLFIARYYKLDVFIINLILELQQNLKQPVAQVTAEDVIYHPWFHTCGKIIFAVIAFFGIRKIPGKQDWDSYISRLDRIPKAVEGSKKIIDYCSEYFNLSTDYVKMMVLGKTREELRRANGLYGEIEEWATEVRKYLDLEERNKIDTDITIANKVEALYKQGLKYHADPLLDRDMARLVSVTLLPARELFQYVSCSPIKGGGPRMRPICVWLAGESGVGKTEMVYPLCIDVLRTMGLMKPEDFHHQVYGRQVETEFWDGYKGQKIVIYDDAFQMKDDKTSPNPEIFEVIRSCNTFPQHLHMAALSDKNTFSSAEMLLYTTNDMNVKLESVTFPDAFFNRMSDNAYVVRPKLENSIKVERGSSGEYYRKLDKTTLNPDKPIDLSIYEFQKLIRDNSSEKAWIEQGEPLNYDDFANVICTQWKKEKARSVEKLRYLEQYAIRAQVGDEIEVYHECEYPDTYFFNDIKERMLNGQDIIDIESEYAEDDRLWTAYLAYKASAEKKDRWTIYKDKISKTLTTVHNYIHKLKEESIKIISQHPYLTILSFVGMTISAFALYKALENTLDSDIETEIGSSGDERTIKQQRTRVEAGTSGDNKTIKQNIKKVEVGTSGDNKTIKQPLKRIEMGEVEIKTRTGESIDEELKDILLTQGCSDMAAHTLITDVLQKNTYRLSYMKGDKRVPFGNCTFLRGWVFAMPYHFLHVLHSRRIAPEALISFSQSKYSDIIQIPLSHLIKVDVDGFTLTSNCIQPMTKDGAPRDCVIVNLHKKMCHPHRDIVKHFVKKDEQGKLMGKFPGTLATFHESGNELHRTYQWLQQIRPLDAEITIYYPHDGYDYTTESYTQRDCYEYNAPTQTGDCGSIVGIYCHRLERKLIGMHIAGSNQEFGYACPLTQDLIDTACLQLVGKDYKNISAQFYYEIPERVNALEAPKAPEGLFCPLGKANVKVGQATKTSLLPSCIHGKITTPTTRPALLKPTMINGIEHNPLLKGLKKCGVDTAVLDDEDVESAAQDVSQVVLTKYNSMLDKSKYQRILTYEEAIRGTLDDDFMCAINRRTSPGYPYSTQNKGCVGKTRWMGKDDEFDFTSTAALELRRDVEQLIEDCKNGKITNVFFVDTLKDERREHAKVDVGKTRVFSAGPQHFVVAFRRYFLPFSAWLMHNRIDNEVAVGTNVYSTDWERIAKRLKKKGKHVIAGDFGNFDGSLVAQVLWAIFWEIFVPWLNQFANFDTEEGLETLKICLGLWTHLVHSVHIFDDNVYMWTHSQPSGNPFTVIINCLYNSIIMRIVWIMIMRNVQPKLMSMKHFRKYVTMISYGDDNCLNISKEVIEFYNQETISAMMKLIKHEYTDEGKTGEIVTSRTLEDIFFLKRGFRFSSELQRTVAPLKIGVIYEMLNWTRNTIDPNVILMTNIETAFREIVYHGRHEYDKLRSAVLGVVDELPSVPQILTYGQYLHDSRLGADDLYEF